MNEINKINLSEQTKFRLSEIARIENYSSRDQSKQIMHQKIKQICYRF